MPKKQITKDDNFGIALYNSNKQELMALFIDVRSAINYLFPYSGKSNSFLISYIRQKVKVHNSVFDFPVAVRKCNEEQGKLLDGNDFVVFGKYPEPILKGKYK